MTQFVRLFSALVLAVSVLAVTAASAFAHQQKAAITSILFNPGTNNIEVSHRFYMHDAEHAVKHIFGKRADIIKSNESQQQFAEYVVARFKLMDAQESELALETVGFEAEGKFFWVYQETPAPAKLQGLSIEHSALQDIWPSQVNTVNIEGKGELQTRTFDGNIELAKVAFHTH